MVCVPVDLLQVLPLLTERQYVCAVHSRLMDSQPWKLPGLQAVCRLAWALSLRVLSQLPQGLRKTPLFCTCIKPCGLDAENKSLK